MSAQKNASVITPDQISDFQNDGVVLLKGLFTEERDSNRPKIPFLSFEISFTLFHIPVLLSNEHA